MPKSRTLRGHAPQEAEILKQIPYPLFMNRELVERFAAIPLYESNNPKKPEWRETPVILADLSRYGYGIVLIKDESDKRSNPTGTFKDRLAWEVDTIYREMAISLDANPGIDPRRVRVPRFSIITNGNAGLALAKMFEKYWLPPVKLLIDTSCPEERVGILLKQYADVYRADLRGELGDKDIRKLTNNSSGIEIDSSIRCLDLNSVAYDWHVFEALNQGADKIFVPYGSGLLFENYLTWQRMIGRMSGNIDPRLKVPQGAVPSMNIMAAEPRMIVNSSADKLVKYHNPFAISSESDWRVMKKLGLSGHETGKYRVPEEYIDEAYRIMSKFVPCEKSSSAGLALYLFQYDMGMISPDEKCLAINTGKGI